MRFAKMAGTALLVGSTALAFAMPANSAPLMTAQGALSAAAPSSVDNVQYRRWHGHHHGGGGAGALIGGLAAGAIIGGAIAASQANAAAQQHAAYCAQRYRSYDPASNTFLARDGNRYPCQ